LSIKKVGLFRGSGFKVQGSGFRVQGSRFKVQGSGFKGYNRWTLLTIMNIDHDREFPTFPIG
jgi:hypothetical protein